MSTPRAKLQVMTLTERAAERVKALSADKAAGAALRIGVKTGGCAGMEYTLEWADAPQPFDEVVESHGARVLVDAKAVMFLLGAEMDWRTEKLSAQFVFSNPNQTGACGCGESVKLAPAAGVRPSGSDTMATP
jgi:iron-sulfur cluster assembly protein